MAKKPYTPPIIQQQIAGNAGKFSSQNQVPVRTDIEGVSIGKLLDKYGSPLFVFSEKSIREKYRRAVHTFSLHYPKVQFTWSYKTNYLNAVCAVFHSEGAWAEVVSGMEYERARRLGVPGNRIIFNGPGKKEPELELAAREGATINVDHLDELFLLEKVAQKIGRKPRVAIRCNMDTGIYPHWSRFGFNLDNNEAYNAVTRLIKGDKLDLVGLHAHIGTFILDTNAYYVAAAKLLNLAQRIREDFDLVLRFIDLGGGFASANTLHEQYLPGEHASPSLDQYAVAITRAFDESEFARKHNPTLILETGRALIDEAGWAVTTVLGKKRLPDGRRTYIIDAGVNILFTAWWYKYNVYLTRRNTGTLEDSVVNGPLCMHIDVIRPSVALPDVAVGEQLLLHPVGAYNVTQWMQFIDYRPNVVLIDPEGNTELIRERETLDDVMQREILPQRLRLPQE